MNMSGYGKNAMSMMLCTFIVSVIAITASIPIQAGGAGAFLGGIAVARIGQNMHDRTEAEQQQAYYAQQQASIAQAQAAAPSSAEDKIRKLDNLLAGGYITRDEYAAQKQKILNNL
jgi:membrane protease subunit (stomatin/prohibitin family)